MPSWRNNKRRVHPTGGIEGSSQRRTHTPCCAARNNRSDLHQQRQLFASGMANYLQVITAESNVLQSELELAVITWEQVTGVELYKALGGDWK